MSRRIILALLISIPCPAIASQTVKSCNYLVYYVELPRPIMAIQSEPLEPTNGPLEIAHGTKEVCYRLEWNKDGSSHPVPGSRTVTWKWTVHEDTRQTADKRPVSTMLVSPKE